MLIRVVSKTKGDVVELAEGLVVGAATFGEADVLGADELVELDGVVGGLALAVGSQHEDGELVLGEAVQVVEVVLFQVGHHGLEAKARMALLGQTRGIVLGGARLAAVEDDAVLVRLLHLLYYVARLARLRGAIGVGQRVAVRVAIDGPVGALGEVGDGADEECREHHNVERVQLRHFAERR